MIGVGVLILVAIAGSVYGAYLMKRDRERQVADMILAMERELESPVEEEPQGRPFDRLAARLQRLMPAAMLESYNERLRWVGRPYNLDAGQFVTVKIILAMLLPALIPVILLFQLGSLTILAMICGAVVGFFLPDMWLNSQLEQRKRLVQEELPLFTDLIATAVSAGLSLTEAVRRVAADAPGLVAREFLRAVQEMAAGKQRAQAWRDLMERLPGDELRSIVTAIMQAEQYGTSVSEILRYQVQQIRTFKQQEAQRLAQAATVKMRIPMLLLILVPFMVLLLGPAMLQIAQLLL